MKRILTCGVLAFVLLSTSQASAQREEGDMLLTVNVSAWLAKGTINDELVTGWGLGFPLEALILDGKMTAGVFLGFYTTQEKIEAAIADLPEIG